MRPWDLVLTVGAALRLTRFVTTDALGYWSIVRPAQRWAARHESNADPTASDPQEVNPDDGARSKLVSGLDCPFCVGYWIGALVVGSHYLAKRHPSTLSLWRGVASTLALNYATGHISARIEDMQK